MKTLITAAMLTLAIPTHAEPYNWGQREAAYQLEGMASDTQRIRQAQERQEWDNRVQEQERRREALEREEEREQARHCRRYPSGYGC